MDNSDIIKAVEVNRGNCFRCESSVFDQDLNYIEKLTYLALTSFEQSCNKIITLDELARAVSCSTEEVSAAVKTLNSRGLCPSSLHFTGAKE